MNHNSLNNRLKNRHILIYISLVQLIFILQIAAQSMTVSGKVTSSRFPVRNALLVLIDEGDTSKQYTTLTDSRGNYEIGMITSVNSGTSSAPAKFNLGQSYPNPFSSTTAIPYGLNEESKIEVTIYDILGRVVRKFDAGRQSMGTHSILWDGRNSLGQFVANGVYFYKLNADGQSQVKKMVFNQNGNRTYFSPGMSPLSNQEFLSKSIVNNNIKSTSFTIRLENSENTIPLIVPLELKNIVIQNDTTINLDVETLSYTMVNADSMHQIIRGFGAANILMWRPDMTESEVERAFGTDDDQLGFSILRLMVEPDSNRWYLSVPSAKKAYEMGATIIAAPWFAPSEIEENVGSIRRVMYDKYAEYAEHLNSFVRYMNDNGVPIYGVSIQNEPDITENWTSWTPDEMLRFMRDYAHTIEGTYVMAPESFQFRRDMSDPILNDPVAAENTDIVCGHIYGGGLSEYTLAEEKGKEVWMTEHLSGEDSQANDWDWAFEVAREMNAVMNAGMSAYVWWYIVRYYGPLSDGTNDSGRKGEITKKGYVMSQFSKFIRPGYYRIETDNAPLSNVSPTAYKDPATGKVVIVVVNSEVTEVDHKFQITNGDIITSFTPYTTSIAKDVARENDVQVTDGSFNYTLLPVSITTFVSN